MGEPPPVPLLTAELAADAAKRLLRGVYLAARGQALRACRRPQPGARALAHPRRILVIRLDRLGDVVLTTALLRALRRGWPDAHLACLVRGPFVALLRAQSYLSEVIAASARPLQDRPWLASLRSRAWDLVIDPLNGYSLQTARLTRLIGPAMSVGYDVAGRGVYYTHPLAPPKQPHLADQSTAVLAALGFDRLQDDRPQLSVPYESETWAGAWFSQRPAGPWIAAHVGGHFATQRLPEATMGKAAAAIAQKLGAGLLVMAGPSEEARARIAADSARRSGARVTVETASGLNIEQTAALLARCRLVLANNSGPLHLAAALGVPTVSTMGPTRPELFSPRGSGSDSRHSVVRLGVACSPCNLGWCSHHTCLAAVTADQLVLAAEGLTADKPQGQG